MLERVLEILLISGVALLPILGWAYIFQKMQVERRSYVILTFVAGMLSVVPIKLYEKYWDTTFLWFENINLFQYLAQVVQYQSLSALLSYIIISILVAGGLFIFTAFLMFILEVVSGDNSVKVYRSKVARALESPFFFVSIGVLFGLIAYAMSLSLNEKIWFFAVVGMIEEYVKHLVLRFSDEYKIRSIDDAVEFAILVGLGFAFVENILYFDRILVEPGITNFEVFAIMALRSTISVAAHICFAAVFAYFYGVARFSNEIYLEDQLRNRHPIVRKIHQILHLKGSTLFHEEKMMEGMLIAVGLHAIFNLVLEFQKVALLLPLVFFLLFMVVNLFHRRTVHVRSGNLIRRVGISLE